MRARSEDLAEKRRILQLETLYDLSLSLHSDRSEEDLVGELLQQVCAVVDPAAAVAITRDAFGAVRAMTTVGWVPRAPSASELLADPLMIEVAGGNEGVARRDGALAGRRYEALLAVPLRYRGACLGFLAVLDKESREESGFPFSTEDRRFLDSVAALAGAALDAVRQLEDLETQRERLVEENRALKGQLVEELAGHRIVAQAPGMRTALDMLRRVAPRGISVLLRGESGTGKELAAKLLHAFSARDGVLIALNCAALPEGLLESELFGIEGGVATGVQARRGKFVLADGGTLFLDEIGDLQASLQVKLLRALQEREVLPVGGQKPIPVDVRVVAATHRDLEDLVADKRFREDLYYRLRGVEIVLPPLRERRQDVPQLVRTFVEDFCRREGIPVPVLEPDALAFLLAYDYPGNVRELQNLVSGAVALADGRIGVELLRSLVAGEDEPETDEAMSLHAVEARHIERVLRLTGGNKSQAAKLLGVDRRTLQRKGF